MVRLLGPQDPAWDQVIEREIDTVQAIVVLWSAASIKSDWVKTEAREGKARGILIPALIEQTTLPFEFRQLQTANLIGWTTGSAHPEFDEFVSGLASLLTKSPTPEEMRTPAEPAREAEQAEQRPQVGRPTRSRKPLGDSKTDNPANSSAPPLRCVRGGKMKAFIVRPFGEKNGIISTGSKGSSSIRHSKRWTSPAAPPA